MIIEMIISADIDQFYIENFEVRWHISIKRTIHYKDSISNKFLPKEFYNITTIKCLGLYDFDEISDKIINFRKVTHMCIEYSKMNINIMKMEKLDFIQYKSFTFRNIKDNSCLRSLINSNIKDHIK